MRAIKKMAEKDLLEYKPPFRGTEIKVIKTIDSRDVGIDFDSLREKAARAYEKLDEMENYVYHAGCRQQYILNYFGDYKAKPCGKCDSCLRIKRQGGKSIKREYLINE